MYSVLFLGLAAFLYLRKSKKNDSFEYEDYSPKPNNNIKRDDSVEHGEQKSQFLASEFQSLDLGIRQDGYGTG